MNYDKAVEELRELANGKWFSLTKREMFYSTGSKEVDYAVCVGKGGGIITYGSSWEEAIKNLKEEIIK